MSESRIPPEELQPEAPAPDNDKNNKKEKEKPGFAADCYGWLQALSVALLILIVLFTFFGRIIGVDGSSMVPTLHNGDMLFLQCIGYEPKQGDIVVLHKDFADITSPIVKRIIALGGQTVRVDYNTSTVYVDGEPIDEPYLGEPMYVPGSAYEQQTYWEVPAGSVFVMGDNRNASSDSRHSDLGTVDTRYILGKAQFIILPFQRIGSVY